MTHRQAIKYAERTGFQLDLYNYKELRLVKRLGKMEYIMYVANGGPDAPVKITAFYALEDGSTYQHLAPEILTRQIE